MAKHQEELQKHLYKSKTSEEMNKYLIDLERLIAVSSPSLQIVLLRPYLENLPPKLAKATLETGYAGDVRRRGGEEQPRADDLYAGRG